MPLLKLESWNKVTNSMTAPAQTYAEVENGDSIEDLSELVEAAGEVMTKRA